MSPTEFADHMDVSRQAVYKAIADGRVPVVRGRLNVDEAEAAWRANTRASVGDPDAGGTVKDDDKGPNYHRARATRETVRARREQLELEELLGRKIDADQVRLAQFEHGRRTRDALIAMASQISPKLAASSSRRDVERILVDELRRVLDDLSRAPLEQPAAGAAAGAAS